MTAPRIALHGATGRMGAAILEICRRSEIPIVGAVAERGCKEIDRDLGDVHGTATYGVAVTADVSTGLLGADVVVDFSHASALTTLVRAVSRAKLPLVTGTTGFDDASLRNLNELATSVPVLWAPNFSLGIQVLVECIQHAVKRLGSSFDAELVEVHHRGKVDAPSGTACRLAREVQSVREDLSLCHNRQGHIGRRPDNQLGVLAVRGGDVVGDHTLHLMGPGERLELTHRATSREVFAQGALFAARAIVGRAPGRLSLADILS